MREPLFKNRVSFFLLLLLFCLKKSPAKLLSPPSRPGTLISYGRRGYASNYTTRISFLPRSLSFFIFPKKKGKRKNSNDTKTKEKFLLPYRLRKNGKTNERKDGILARSSLSLSPRVRSDFWKCTLHSNLLSDNPIRFSSEILYPLAFDSINIPTSFALLSTSSSSSLDTRRAAFYRSARERADICSSGVRGRNVGN